MKEVERLKREMQADDQDLDLNGENEDEEIYTNDQLLARHSSSSINLVAEDPPSVSPLPPHSVNDSDNSVKVPNAGGVSDTGEEGLRISEKSGKQFRERIRKQTSDLLLSAPETGITKASNEGDVHLVSSAESPTSQEMSKRDKRRARQAKKADLEANNNLSVWMTALSTTQLSDQYLLATLQLLCTGLRKQNSIIQPHLRDWPCSFP